MAISPNDYAYVCELLLSRFGNRLEVGKEYLIEARFQQYILKAGLASVDELLLQLRQFPHSTVATGALEALTINETLFFRDEAPFQVLREKALPELFRRRSNRKSLSIWSAACSSGQEPYSIAISVQEAFPLLLGWSVKILATDICSSVLAKAKDGKYNMTDVRRGLSQALLDRHFERDGQDWKVKAGLRSLVRFLPMNLCRQWPAMPKMDVIFLRNVLIYMPDEQKRNILNSVKAQLEPDGYLFLGATETTYQLTDGFANSGWERSGCYHPV